MSELEQLNSVVNLRKAAADVIIYCDVLIQGTGAEITYAKHRLPRRIRLLQVRAARALTALEEGQ